MDMKLIVKLSFGVITTVLISTPAFAVPVSWTDWVSSESSSAIGQIIVGSTVVGVSYANDAPSAFVQTGTGIDYWTGAAYTNGTADNAPTSSELIALGNGGTVTIDFTEAIEDPFIAMNSWNSNVVDFGVPISIDSFGHGYWGTGTAVLNDSGTGFTGAGEFHGVIALSGSFDSVTFSHTSEYWHGFTVGVAGLADSGPAPVPEPTTMLLFGAGLAGLAGLRTRRKE